jgi:two-component system, LytTR family, response regulator
MIRAIIIDDEHDSRTTVANILMNYCNNISVVGQAANVNDGLSLIARKKPDVIFLDIQMPDGTGFDLLERIKKVDFQIIFVTAFDKYALRAIKFSALDYILKPVDPHQLIEAVEKIRKKPLGFDEISQKLKILLRNKDGFERMSLPTLEGFKFVNIKDIVRCESESNYTWFYLNSGEKTLVTRTLKEYEEILSHLNFFRIHQSHLVNLKYIDRYVKGDGGTVVMVDGAEVEVSRRRKEGFLKAMMGG